EGSSRPGTGDGWQRLSGAVAGERTRCSLRDVWVITHGDAERDAAAAAARASVVMGEVDTVAGLRGAADLFARIWGAPAVPPVPHDVLRGLVHAGGRGEGGLSHGALVGARGAVVLGLRRMRRVIRWSPG